MVAKWVHSLKNAFNLNTYTSKWIDKGSQYVDAIVVVVWM